MKINSNTPFKIKEIENMMIQLNDGCKLAARLWMPIDALEKPVPAVLEYIPYRKRDGTIYRDHLIHPYVAGQGYVCLRVDMRGSGDSEGLLEDEYSPQELSDARELINWISKQPWCSGNVGMMGKSWGGFNSLQVAALAPKPLKAIATGYTSTKRYSDDIHYKGGCLLNDNLRWAGVMLAYSARPPDPILVGESWKDIWLQRLKNEPFLAFNWLSHQTYDDYWKHGSVSENFNSIEAAVLVFGGWADNYMNAVPQLVNNLKTNVKGIIGPWVHQYPHMAAPSPQIGFLQEMVSWWNIWLKGINKPDIPNKELIFYLQDSVRPKRHYSHRPGKWCLESSFPSERIINKKFFLSENGLNKGSQKQFSRIVSSPTNCGVTQGEFFPMALASEDCVGPPEQAGDQRIDDAVSACFDTELLESPLSIVGRSILELMLESNVPQAQIAVRLCDVHPDGASTKICHGLLNLSHRKSDETPSVLKINERTAVDILLDETAYIVPRGHKLRVAISTQYWPFVWPSASNTTIEISQGVLNLNLFNGKIKKDEYKFEEPEASEEWNFESLRTGDYNRTLEDNYGTGEVILRINSDFGRVKDNNHGLTTDQLTNEIWTINKNDPLSATGEIEWFQELSREDWIVKINTKCSMSADEDFFYINAAVNASERCEKVFERTFSHKIKRNYI